VVNGEMSLRRLKLSIYEVVMPREEDGVLQSATPKLRHVTLMSFLHLFTEETIYFLMVAPIFSLLGIT
jgi:hypothetical protein